MLNYFEQNFQYTKLQVCIKLAFNYRKSNYTTFKEIWLYKIKCIQ